MTVKEKVICGLQQVGIGVRNAAEAWAWYTEILGFDIKICEDEGIADKMLPYTGGNPQPRYAILAMNLKGGGGLEIWEPRERELNYPHLTPKLGDYGVFACKIRAADIKAAYQEMKDKGVTQALNLDGGNTMALMFRGRMLNKEALYQNRKFVRSVTSLIGIGSTEIP
jgi:catechol 2,3-dioxygenase-like lactoylglutathione lyase family enzyme